MSVNVLYAAVNMDGEGAMLGIESILGSFVENALAMGGAEFVTSIASGTVLAGMGYGSKKVIDLVKEWHINKKFNLSGEYLTYYDDNHKGCPVTVKALAILKQKGKSIVGNTGLDKHDRDVKKEWELKASIVKDKYVTGYYANVDARQMGIGTFFLKIDNALDLDGSWSGYDEESNNVSHGKYVFRRAIPVVIRPIGEGEYDAAMDLGSSYLGDGYVLALQHRDRYETLVAEYNNNVVGFVSFGLINIEDVPASLVSRVVGKEKGLRSAYLSGKIYLLVSACVEKEWQGRGVGLKLLSKAIEKIKEKKPSFILAMAWKHGGKVYSHGMLINQGFTVGDEIHDYWKQFSIDKKAECPVCGNPCNCSAVVYKKRL